MCGFAGLAGAVVGGVHYREDAAEKMTAALAHRGPDSLGIWADEHVALGHRRLAILDLSDAGAQPMRSHCGRYVVAYNGEIYNHVDLRAELEKAGKAPKWQGHSDTETLLALVSAWGVERAAERLVGMFAIALWDRRDRVLNLLRDRLGEKPLYYGWAGTTFLFASELKAIRAVPGFRAEVDPTALAYFLRYTYVPAPFSMLRGVFKLEPGCHLVWSGACEAPSAPLRPGDSHRTVRLRRWWSLAEVAERGAVDFYDDDETALAALESALASSVKRQMLSDVPLGAFLSGGIDSSMITALMQQYSERLVRTFTIGFDEAGFDESPHAAAVARHLGTDHTEVRVSASEAREVIPSLPDIYDEPFADSSQIPTHLVCRIAREHVTVALSGDAGDELFGGYNRYRLVPRLWRRLGRMPRPARRALAGVLAGFPPSAIRAALRLRGSETDAAQVGNRVPRLARALAASGSMGDFHREIVSEWPFSVAGGWQAQASKPNLPIFDSLPMALTGDAVGEMQFRDCLSYLPDDILCKVDRAAMAVSLETRVPFLDPAVIDVAWRLPLSMKIRDGQGKWLVRQLLYRHVPKRLIERPKAGFAIPIGAWLRGPLRDWAEALLDPVLMQQQGYIDPVPVRQAWEQHLSGRRDWTPRLWTVLMFQAWLAHWHA